MSNTKFTPGPWKIKFDNNAIESANVRSYASGLSVWKESSDGEIAIKIADISLNIRGIKPERKFSGEETEYNAAIISAVCVPLKLNQSSPPLVCQGTV